MTRRSPGRFVRAVAVTALALTSVACGATGVPAADAPPVGTAGNAPAAVPGLATTATDIGAVVTSDGFAVYLFDRDSADPPTSTCVDTCAERWQPVLGDGLPPLQGIDSAMVGTIGRPDGGQQLTLGGWPLYTYAEDTVPGEVRGEGVGGVWRAIGPDGTPAAGAPSAPVGSAEPTAAAVSTAEPPVEGPDGTGDGY
ncbi:MAG TPA: hypothetical protein VM367_08835 [Pseudonocardia sp.]|jgi:predicted lipoprotein with Yx(FWY)xxD motif|nr:hypothetical protein [Pseudonocardia sp.]